MNVFNEGDDELPLLNGIPLPQLKQTTGSFLILGKYRPIKSRIRLLHKWGNHKGTPLSSWDDPVGSVTNMTWGISSLTSYLWGLFVSSKSINCCDIATLRHLIATTFEFSTCSFLHLCFFPRIGCVFSYIIQGKQWLCHPLASISWMQWPNTERCWVTWLKSPIGKS